MKDTCGWFIWKDREWQYVQLSTLNATQAVQKAASAGLEFLAALEKGPQSS